MSVEPVAPGPRPAGLVLHYVPGDDIGYGRVGAGLADALRRQAVEVVDAAPAGHGGSVPRVVTWISSPFHALGCRQRQRPTLLTMWETDRLPRSFRRTLGRFATVMVPSDKDLELFGAEHPDVHRVSFGVDPARWPCTPRRTGNDFVFFISGTGTRKGIDLAHDAFRRAFPTGWWGSGRQPVLVIKGRRNERYGGERVRIVAGPLSADDERRLYDDAHCYVQPSRGEGFGLQPLQAIAMGIPTILTDAHGHRAYAHLGIPVPARKVPSDLFALGEAGHWWEADLDHLVDTMRWVYEHEDVAVERATASAGVVAELFTWERGARELIDALGGRSALASVDPAGPWRSFGEPEYRVVTRRDFVIRSAGAEHCFSAGAESAAPAHVKRLLFEAGLLDERCIDHLPIRRLSATELARLPAAQRDEYLAWVVEAKRLPAR